MTTIDTSALLTLGIALYLIGLAIGFRWGFNRGLTKGQRLSQPHTQTTWTVQGKG